MVLTYYCLRRDSYSKNAIYQRLEKEEIYSGWLVAQLSTLIQGHVTSKTIHW
jgi:hypothetical protein